MLRLLLSLITKYRVKTQKKDTAVDVVFSIPANDLSTSDIQIEIKDYSDEVARALAYLIVCMHNGMAAAAIINAVLQSQAPPTFIGIISNELSRIQAVLSNNNTQASDDVVVKPSDVFKPQQ